MGYDQKVPPFEHWILPLLLVNEFEDEANIKSLIESNLVFSLHFSNDANQVKYSIFNTLILLIIA